MILEAAKIARRAYNGFGRIESLICTPNVETLPWVVEVDYDTFTVENKYLYVGIFQLNTSSESSTIELASFPEVQSFNYVVTKENEGKVVVFYSAANNYGMNNFNGVFIGYKVPISIKRSVSP